MASAPGCSDHNPREEFRSGGTVVYICDACQQRTSETKEEP